MHDNDISTKITTDAYMIDAYHGRCMQMTCLPHCHREATPMTLMLAAWDDIGMVQDGGIVVQRGGGGGKIS